MKKIYVVSDLHLGDRSGADNFAPFEDRFLSFYRTLIAGDNDAKLILAGDIFDFWQAEHGQIIKEYYDLLVEIFDKSTFVVGNHDIDLRGFIGLSVLQSVKEKLSIEENIGNIRIIHGNEFDNFNDVSSSTFTGRLMALIMGNLEKDGAKINSMNIEYFSQLFIEPILRKAIIFFSKLHLGLYKTASNKNKLTTIQRVLENYHENNPGQIIVAGHTHRAGWFNDYYVNCGAWCVPVAHYVKIENGIVKLFEWPSQQEVNTQVDFTRYN
jgi:UDP-2,3-diacylglucosamine pyrophosphatase LpxH